MNILYVSECAPKAAGAQVLNRTLTGMAKRGNKIFYVCCSPQLPEPLSDKRTGYLHANITWIGRRMSPAWFRPMTGALRLLSPIRKLFFLAVFLLHTVRLARGLLQEMEIDVIYGYEIYGAIAARCLARGRSVPVVTRFQGTILRPLLGRWCQLLRRWDHVLGLRSPGDLTIMTNDGTGGDIVLRELGSPVKELRFWMNGVDPRQEVSSEAIAELLSTLNIPNDAQVILTLSRLARWKRIDRAIRALSYIVDDCPRAHLLIVGYGAARQELEALVRELHLEHRVTFAGKIGHDQIPVFLQSADVFLSLYDLSNVGNPLLEAMCYGKCIVTLNNGETSQVVQDNENGILISVTDSLIFDVASAITNMLRHPEERERLGKNSRTYADLHFRTWEERVEDEILVVQQLCRGR